MDVGKIYITGTTMREYNFGSFVTPRRRYTDDEILAGKSTIVTTSADVFSTLSQNKLFNSLLSQGVIKASKTKPIVATTSVVEIRSTYESEIDDLKAQLAQKEADYDALKQEALNAIAAAKTGDAE